MCTIDITSPCGEICKHGIIMIFSLNATTYAATIRVKLDATPYAVDTSLFKCIIHDEHDIDLFDIDDAEMVMVQPERFYKEAMRFLKGQPCES